MRLIHTETLALAKFFGDQIPPYVILSHTWQEEEAIFHDWADLELASRKKGYTKIIHTCRVPNRQGYDYVWVDTNYYVRRIRRLHPGPAHVMGLHYIDYTGELVAPATPHYPVACVVRCPKLTLNHHSACMREFTKGQQARMQDNWNQFRARK